MALLTVNNRPEQFQVMEFKQDDAHEVGMLAREMSLRAEFQAVSLILTDPDPTFDFKPAYEAMNARASYGISCLNNFFDKDYQNMSHKLGFAFDVFTTIASCYEMGSRIFATGYAAPSNLKTHIDGPPDVIQSQHDKSVVMTMSVNDVGSDLIEAPASAFIRKPHGWDNYLHADPSELKTWNTSAFTINIMRMSNWPEEYLPCPHNIPEGKAYQNADMRSILIARPSLGRT